MASSPRVSVLLPVYNGEQFLDEAMRSVLDQSFADFEVIVVDDGSQDASPAILAGHAAADPRVRVYRKANGGIVAALNFGLGHCRGEYVARMDADDVCLPHRFADQVAHLDANPDCVLVGGLAETIDAHGQSIAVVSGGPHKRTRLDIFPPKVAVSLHPLVTIRRSALEAIGGYRDAFPHAEDYDLYLRLARLGSIDNPPKVMLKYRKHGQSVSQKNVALQEQSAARAELAAIIEAAGRHTDPGPGSDAAGMSRRFPATLVESYAKLRTWKRLRADAPALARALRGELMRAALTLQPATIASRPYLSLRLRIAKNLLFK